MLKYVICLCLLFAYMGVATKHIYKEDETTSSTTSDVLQTKMDFTFSTNNNKQDYIISWNAEIYASNLAEAIQVHLMFNGVIFNEQDWHPNPDGPNEDGWAVASGWKFVDLNAGSHTFTVDYRSMTAGQEVKIRRVRIMATPANVIIL